MLRSRDMGFPESRSRHREAYVLCRESGDAAGGMLASYHLRLSSFATRCLFKDESEDVRL